MEVSSVIYRVLGLLFLPPGLGVTLVLVFGVGVFFLTKHSKWRTIARCMFVLSLVTSFALTTRAMGYQLALLVEGDELRALTIEKLQQIQVTSGAPGAIVILGGGLKHDGRERPHELNLNQRTALRIHYGAFLAKAANIPVLVSGGIGPSFTEAESTIMTRSLNKDYGVEVRWQESHSRTTAENAFYSAVILKAQGIKKIVLVTQAYHMRRSALSFEAQGIEVIMAPCGFLGAFDADTSLAWLPAIGGVEATYMASHEIVGLVYYWLRGYISRFSYAL
jgi:uncharacterized SAM-binding protein YcdF (DUF218 family)